MSYGVYVTKPSQAPAIFLFVLLCLASRVEWERWALYTYPLCPTCHLRRLTVWNPYFILFSLGGEGVSIIACVLTSLGPLTSFISYNIVSL